MGKSSGVDNIPADLVQAGGEALIDVLTSIWFGRQENGRPQGLSLPKKGNLQLCQNYRTISLISHPSKVMLKIILNRLQPQAEEIIAEEQASFRAGRSTHRSNIQSQDSLWEIPAASAESTVTSRRPLTRYGTKPYGQLWGNTTSTPASYKPLKICMTRPREQSYSMAAQRNGSELQ